jgi:hypothetical protein
MADQSSVQMDAETAERTLAAAAVAGPYQQSLSPAQAVQCAVAVLGRDMPPPEIQRYLRERGIHIGLPMVQQELADYLESTRLERKSPASVPGSAR